MNKNREFAELMGIPWNDEEFDMPTSYYDNEKKEWVHGIIEIHNPDYAAEPRLVLREMMKRGDWTGFLSFCGTRFSSSTFMDDETTIDLILDTTGKLRDAAIEWMKGKNEGSN